ncbi:MAG: alpha-1,4-glucan--maltose-1-phosphate maltosyltransferase [Alphaproteobacteria bacterium]|nr:alpha-1,4-glucan--maltose-1-phosphate maltosyltransferase [Alphaproteobacteria bacterium]
MPAAIEARYRQRYAFAAAFSSGLMMPIGYEWGWARAFGSALDRSDGVPEEERFDLTAFIAAVNAMKRATPALETNGPQRPISPPDDPILALARCDVPRAEWAFTLLNRDPQATRAIETDALLAAAPGRHLALDEVTMNAAVPIAARRLEVPPLGIRILRGRPPLAPSEPARPLPAAALHPQWRPEARITIENIAPAIDGGRYAIKRVVGDAVEVEADILRDGHDKLSAAVKFRRIEEAAWHKAPMRHVDNDRWAGSFTVASMGRHVFVLEAWTDHFESWRSEVEKKRAAGQDLALELIEGEALIAAARMRADAADAASFDAVIAACAGALPEERALLLLSRLIAELMARWPDRADAVSSPMELEIVVDRPAARFAAWYEMFQRSQGTLPGRGASFADCAARLPEIAALGFDVVYLVPVHPIGRINRKGRDNAVTAAPGDPGSPYAIGSAEGGHCAIHPELGTLDDFRGFVAAAAAHGMEVALDFAVQCAPDHPWIAEHPEWFAFRPDGSIRYAENPPKKYQDIVNVDFYNPDREALWHELLDVILFWVEAGVRIFRVDNPHTKPTPFWEWCIRKVKAQCPEVLFLSEAFTRPKIMKLLAKAGFTQSYSYFTWRNTKDELTTYLTELTRGPEREYMQPNFFTNTPDILPRILQEGGRPAFITRFVLAATLSPAYGIYNGFELCENTPVPGSEEYLHSEKYEYKVWDWDRPGNIKAEIAAVNRLRRENPALQLFANVTFCPSDDVHILAYVKQTPDRANTILVVVNLDPDAAHEAVVDLPLQELALSPNEAFLLEDALSLMQLRRRGAHHRFRLDPADRPFDIFRLTRERR